jgi:drug/metabolite transporter (DMT)-like permease
MKNGEKKGLFALILLAVSAIWGGAFVIMKDALDRLDDNSFLAWRFSIATLILIILKPKVLTQINRKFLLKGVLVGTFLGSGYIFQSFGLTLTTVAKTGFITGLYVVFTPVLGAIVLKKKIAVLQWASVALATAGLLLLSFKGFHIGLGEFLVFLSAIVFAAHIIALGEWSSGMDTYALTVVQLGTCAVITTLAGLKSGLHAPPDSGVWWAIIFCSVFATAIAFIFQTWAQSFMAATTVAVILTMEVVFAAIFGIAVSHESLTTKTAVGGLMVIVAMYSIIYSESKELKVNTVAK